MARGDANRKPYPLKPSAGMARPMDPKEAAEILARQQAELDLMNARNIEGFKEQAKRQAARAADQAKRAEARNAIAEQKHQRRRELKDGPQRQLDELRKQLEALEREREKVEHQIEELERQQEQLDEQPETDQDSDAQSGASESDPDSTEIPRQ